MGLTGFFVGLLIAYFTYGHVKPFFCIFGQSICAFLPGVIIWAIILALILYKLINI